MDKEKEIEELSVALGIRYQNLSRAATLDIATAITKAGYRKADEVRKETAIEIYNSLIDETVWETDTIIISVDWLKDKIKNYGIEVDE